MLSVIGVGLRAAVGWVTKNPLILLLAIFTAAFAMVVVGKNSEISTLNRLSKEKDGRITNLVTSLGQARANVATLANGVQAQNASILALKEQGDAAGAKFDNLIAGMASFNATTATRLRQLASAKPGADKCVSALDLVHGAASQ